jgi:hypothetical protein
MQLFLFWTSFFDNDVIVHCLLLRWGWPRQLTTGRADFGVILLEPLFTVSFFHFQALFLVVFIYHDRMWPSSRISSFGCQHDKVGIFVCSNWMLQCTWKRTSWRNINIRPPIETFDEMQKHWSQQIMAPTINLHQVFVCNIKSEPICRRWDFIDFQ